MASFEFFEEINFLKISYNVNYLLIATNVFHIDRSIIYKITLKIKMYINVFTSLIENMIFSNLIVEELSHKILTIILNTFDMVY